LDAFLFLPPICSLTCSKIEEKERRKERKKERKEERKKERKKEKDGWNGASAHPLATVSLRGVNILHQINHQDCN
jgi:hypothetical protein